MKPMPVDFWVTAMGISVSVMGVMNTSESDVIEVVSTCIVVFPAFSTDVPAVDEVKSVVSSFRCLAVILPSTSIITLPFIKSMGP